MSQFRFLILFFVLVSCHQAPPSKMQTYQKAKAQNSVQRSIAFVQAQQSLLHRSSTKDQLLVLQNPAVRADAIQLLDNIYKLQDSLVPNHASNNSYPSSTSHIPAKSRFIALHQKVRDTESMQAIINDLLNQNKKIDTDIKGYKDVFFGMTKVEFRTLAKCNKGSLYDQQEEGYVQDDSRKMGNDLVIYEGSYKYPVNALFSFN